MLEFVGEWSDTDKEVVNSLISGVNGKIGGKSYVANPWTLVKNGDNVKVETDRHTVKAICGSLEVVGKAIRQYYIS